MKRHHPEFLEDVRRLPCLRCGKRPVEAAHIRLTSSEWTLKTGVPTGAGGAQKPFDTWVLPLCARCHRTGPNAEHVVGTVEFYRCWNVDPHKIAWALFTRRDDFDGMAAVAAAVLYLDYGKPKEPRP